MRKDVAIGAGAVGAAIMGAAIYYFREKTIEQPAYRVLQSDGDFEIRSYPEMTVAETLAQGPRKDALENGFRVLADYIFAKSRDGEKIPMTAPVMQDSGNPMASDPPLFDDTVEGHWRVRFVMPQGRSASELPEPPEKVEIVALPSRRVGAVRFSGTASNDRLVAEEDRLRGWLSRQSEASANEPEYAFYNSPMIPAPLRRNEVLIPLG